MEQQKKLKSFPVNIIKFDTELTAHGFVTAQDRQELSEEMGFNKDYIYKIFHSSKERIPRVSTAGAVTIETKYGIKRVNYECLEEEAKTFQDKFFNRNKEIVKAENKAKEKENVTELTGIENAIKELNKTIIEELIYLNTSVKNLTTALLKVAKEQGNNKEPDNSKTKPPFIYMEKINESSIGK